MDSVPLLGDLQGKIRTLDVMPRLLLWKNDHRFARWGDFKYASSGDDNVVVGLEVYDRLSNLRDNPSERLGEHSPESSVASAIDLFPDAFYEEAANPANQDALFSTPQ